MTEPRSEKDGRSRDQGDDVQTFGEHLRDVTKAARLERAQSSFSRGAGGLDLPAERDSASDLLFENSPVGKNMLQVCWQCEKAWDEPDWQYCPLCSADLVEVEKE